jgi:quinoprotein dehydrogenase-associated probable ABC transporter substrate-binding protein
MYSRCLDWTRLVMLAVALGSCGWASGRDLVVCADPDNLPFSNRDRQGFENRIVEIVAEDLGAHVVYRWQPMRRGYVRKSIGSEVCDVVMGVPPTMDNVLTTVVYYRSSYAFVTRRDIGAPVRSLADSRLRDVIVGVPLVGGDALVPAGAVLQQRRAFDNVRGFPVYGERPVGERLVEAVVARRIDVAVIWGPQAVYFAGRAPIPLDVHSIEDDEFYPESFAVSIGVRKDEPDLRDQLNLAIVRQRSRIDTVLDAYRTGSTTERSDERH